jgi:hypothetical protein
MLFVFNIGNKCRDTDHSGSVSNILNTMGSTTEHRLEYLAFHRKTTHVKNKDGSFEERNSLFPLELYCSMVC